MPTKPSRARRWVKSGDATPFWSRGVWCVRLNREPSDYNTQSVAVGVDPGSKKEGVVVASEAHTYINIQADAITHVSDAVTTRRQMRRGRRYRKCPYRANRKNRARGGIPPSTLARWQWKLRLLKWLSHLFPVSDIVVEDIKARTTGKRKWDRSFSPLEVGKAYFYTEVAKVATLHTYAGYETYTHRNMLGLKKSSNKMAEKWEAHCVDAWVLVHKILGGETKPDNTRLMLVTPIRLHRRQLHTLQPAKGGVRRPYGGTRSMGLKRGSLVKHPKWGVTYVGGTMNNKISLHSVESGKRLTQHADVKDCKHIAYSSWRGRLTCARMGIPTAQAGGIRLLAS